MIGEKIHADFADSVHVAFLIGWREMDDLGTVVFPLLLANIEPSDGVLCGPILELARNRQHDLAEIGQRVRYSEQYT